MKTILSFDCATSAGAVCALIGDGDRAGWTERAASLTSLIDDLVEDPRTIEGIVVGTGPGSFTSIRIALATARGLALALDVPVAGSSTLSAFAHGTPVIDARRGEVFSGGGVGAPDELDVAGKTLVGDGAVRYRALFEAAGATIPPDDDPLHRPDPVALAEHAGPFGPVEDVDPLYLRDPDAKPAS
ncbi:MAG TPA: tRNA (adenosine(37)-N6)-threonylcarbamoyltransferase complex dimerization subunit type 1 TsaB [Gaiellaceae bacterium]